MAQLFQLFQITFLPLTGAQPVEDFQHPLGADPAKGTLAAGFRLGKRHEIAGNIHHAIGFIQHHHAAGSHDGAGRFQRFKIDRRIGQFCRNASPGGTADLNGFQFFAVADPAPDLLHNLAQGQSHRNFHQAAAHHFPGQGEGLGTFAPGGAERGECRRAVADNPGQ